MDDFSPSGYHHSTLVKAYHTNNPGYNAYPFKDFTSNFISHGEHGLAMGQIDGQPDKFSYQLLAPGGLGGEVCRADIGGEEVGGSSTSVATMWHLVDLRGAFDAFSGFARRGRGTFLLSQDCRGYFIKRRKFDFFYIFMCEVDSPAIIYPGLLRPAYVAVLLNSPGKPD